MVGAVSYTEGVRSVTTVKVVCAAVMAGPVFYNLEGNGPEMNLATGLRPVGPHRGHFQADAAMAISCAVYLQVPLISKRNKLNDLYQTSRIVVQHAYLWTIKL